MGDLVACAYGLSIDGEAGSSKSQGLLAALVDAIPPSKPGGSGLTTDALATLIIAEHELGVGSEGSGRVQELAARQTATGGWGARKRHPEDIASTAWAVRALGVSQSSDVNNDISVAGGLRRLSGMLDSPDVTLAFGHSTYVLSLVVVALAVAPDQDPALLSHCVKTLRDWQNPDGGWGAGLKEVSGYDSTARALSALFQYGEASWLPTLEVRKELVRLEALLSSLASRVDESESDLSVRVEKACGAVINERDDLREQSKDLREQLNDERLTVNVQRRAQAKSGEIYQELLASFRSFTAAAGAASQPFIAPRVFDRLCAVAVICGDVALFATGGAAGARNPIGVAMAATLTSICSVFLGLRLRRRYLLRVEAVTKSNDKRNSALKPLQLISRFGPLSSTAQHDSSSRDAFVDFYTDQMVTELKQLPGDVAEAVVYQLLRFRSIAPEHSGEFVSQMHGLLERGGEGRSLLEALLRRLATELEPDIKAECIDRLRGIFLS